MMATDSDGNASAGKKWMIRAGWVLLLFVVLGFSLHLFRQQTLTAKNYAPAETAFATVHEEAREIPVQDKLSQGKQIYTSRCVSCHQTNGQGISGVFPPLDGSEWVEGDKGRLIRIVLGGVTGEMEVSGTTYSGAMPPWGMHLDDKEIAALTTFIRQSWSNDTTEVTAEEVKKVRAATQDRSGPWTAEALKKDANTGIPGGEESE